MRARWITGRAALSGTDELAADDTLQQARAISQGDEGDALLLTETVDPSSHADTRPTLVLERTGLGLGGRGEGRDSQGHKLEARASSSLLTTTALGRAGSSTRTIWEASSRFFASLAFASSASFASLSLFCSAFSCFFFSAS